MMSGRFIFTVVCAIVFAVLSINKTLPVDKVMEVILVVVMAYFSRGDRGQNGKTPPTT
jgi:amino acid permease